jgi:hypothetical protein
MAGDHKAKTQFMLAIKLRPWEISPLAVHEIPEPEAGPEGHYDRPWDASWWRARAFRDALEEAAAKLN